MVWSGVIARDVGHSCVVISCVVKEAGTAFWDVLRVDVAVGETECAVDCGGGEEGEQADEEEAGQEEQGGEQHC